MVALVTGGSRGIGSEIVRALAREGYDLAVNYHRSRETAEALVSEIRERYGVSAAAFGCDVASAQEVEGLFADAGRRLGPVGLLVNNAGIARQQLFTDTTPEDWDRLFAVDVRGVYLCSRAALPHMIREKRGGILNISSIWGIAGASCEVAYSAAKAAVIGMTKALAKEVGPSGIRVNCIAPGVIDTAMNHSLGEAALAALREETPLGVLGSAGDVAELAVFLASERARFITGQVISPNGGLVI